MKRAGILLILLWQMGWGDGLEAQEKATGAAAFVRLGASARAIALGRAYTALAGEDAMGMFWNPAGMVLGKPVRLAMTDRFFGDGELGMDGAMSFVSVGTSKRVFGNMAIGAGAMYYGVTGIEKYSSDAVYQGDFSDGELLALLSVARLEGPLAAGVNLRFIRQAFSGDFSSSTSGIGFDLGAIARFWRPVRLGLMVRSKTDMGNDQVPVSASLGAAYERELALPGMKPRLVVALDLEQIKDRPARLHLGLGLERLVSLQGFAFSLRMGRNNQFLEQRLSALLEPAFRDELAGEDFSGPNGQWGIGIGIERSSFALDYTFSRGLLHDPHYLSLSYSP